MSSDWNIRFVTDWDEINSPEFQYQWLEWSETAVNSHVFFHPALSMAWIETYRPLRNLKPIFCIAENKSVVVFIPLVLWKQNWKNAFRKIIISTGYSDFDYHAPVASRSLTPAGWASFYQALLHELKAVADYDAIDLNGLTTEAYSEDMQEEQSAAPFTELAELSNSEDFLLSLKTSLRGDIRRQIRRINELGQLTLHEYTNTDEALDVLPQFLALHSSRWPGAYKAPGFHKNIIVHLEELGILHLTSLKSGEKILSYHLGFQYKKKYYYYMPATDRAFENLSPGKVHLFKLVEYAIDNKYNVFDHLRGDENYKTGWATSVRKLYRLNIQNKKTVSRIKNRFCDLKTKLI